MDKAKLILMRNRKNRVVNGVRPNQIVEVSEANVATYLMYGFEKYDPKAVKATTTEGAKEGNEDLKEGEREAMENFLKSHGVTVAPNWKDATIVKKAKELGYGEGNTFDATNGSEEGNEGNEEE